MLPAQESKVFDSEITSLTATLKKKEILVEKDELPQTTISLEELSRLPTMVDDASVVTAGNSSVSQKTSNECCQMPHPDEEPNVPNIHLHNLSRSFTAASKSCHFGA